MAKSKDRVSYCLKHQDRLATARCSTCLKPLCEDCTQTSELGAFCSPDCYERRRATAERVEILRQQEDALRVPWTVTLYRFILRWGSVVFVVLVAYHAWTHWLPPAYKKPILDMLKSFKFHK